MSRSNRKTTRMAWMLTLLAAANVGTSYLVLALAQTAEPEVAENDTPEEPASPSPNAPQNTPRGPEERVSADSNLSFPVDI